MPTTAAADRYERSFDEFMQQMGRELLQASVGQEKNAIKKAYRVDMARLAYRKGMCCVLAHQAFV